MRAEKTKSISNMVAPNTSTNCMINPSKMKITIKLIHSLNMGATSIQYHETITKSTEFLVDAGELV